MKLWRVSQSENTNYDTYDSFVVASMDEETARLYAPSYNQFADKYIEDQNGWVNYEGTYTTKAGYPYSSWAPSVYHVDVKYVGEASSELQEGEIVCASFNAG